MTQIKRPSDAGTAMQNVTRVKNPRQPMPHTKKRDRQSCSMPRPVYPAMRLWIPKIPKMTPGKIPVRIYVRRETLEALNIASGRSVAGDVGVSFTVIDAGFFVEHLLAIRGVRYQGLLERCFLKSKLDRSKNGFTHGIGTGIGACGCEGSIC